MRPQVLKVGLATAAITFACIKVPEFQHRDGGGPGDATSDDAAIDLGSGAVVMMDGSNVVAVVPNLYELRFSSEGYKFPYNWGIGSAKPLTQVLYAPPNTAPNCALEKDMGAAFFPAQVFASVLAPGAPNPTQREINVELAGPPIARVRLDWAVALPCGAAPNGKSTFTFFPDGRMSRLDIARLGSAADAANCACSGGASWFVTSFATFTRGVIQGVEGRVYPAAGDVGDTVDVECIVGNADAFRIGVGWRAASRRRLRSPDGSSFALVGDMIQPAATIGSASPLLLDIATTYWPSLTATCDVLRQRVRPYTQDTLLELDWGNGSPEPITPGQDSIFGGETSQAAPGRQALGPSLTLRAPVTLGAFALWLDFGVAHSQPTPPIVSKPYLLQRPTATQYLFWFPDGLAAGDTIDIRTGP